MAQENEEGQEKTEEPTEKRKRDAREKGEVARSKELGTMLLLVVGAGALLIFGTHLSSEFLEMFAYNFSIERAHIYDPDMMFARLTHSLKQTLIAVGPILILLFFIALISPIMLGGFIFSTKALMPKFNRLNPLSGLKRMFSKNALVELLKAIAKVAVVGTLSVIVLMSFQNDLLSMAHEPLEPALKHALYVILWAFLGMSATLILIVAIDVPYQLYQFNEKLKMTLQEVKDELKNTEGKPEVKGRIRQLQREMSQRRMMADVPDADVVITNPTHYSVALKYEEGSFQAPILLAKGPDHLALKIREIAREYEIPVLQSPPLTRALYYSTEIGDEIPQGLYMAVAQVLAYVHHIEQFRAGKAKAPGKMPAIEVPEEFQQTGE